MSALASQLPSPDEAPLSLSRPGPTGECAVYGAGDKDDWIAVDGLRRKPRDWATARRIVHEKLGLESYGPSGDKFRYHWRGKCGCWTPELKAWIESQS